MPENLIKCNKNILNLITEMLILIKLNKTSIVKHRLFISEYIR